MNEALRGMDNRQVTLLILLDLSAAFDSVDHGILAQRLRQCCIVEDAHKWIMNYLLGRTQSVCISGRTSPPRAVTCGVPQGSVLGPILFLIYLSGLSDIISPFSIQHTLYADDLQLYVTTSTEQLSSAVVNMQNCIAAVKAWFAQSLLTLNSSKTECILIGTPAMLKKCTVSHIIIDDCVIPFSSSVRDLGVLLDASLDLKAHVSQVCAKSYMRLRLINRLRKSLSQSHFAMLANSLVLSNLDYCTAILYNLPQCTLSKLQNVINAVYRCTHRLCRSDHITSRQQRDGCHTIEQRIQMRIAMIVHTTLTHGRPLYIQDWLAPVTRERELRSNNLHLLESRRVNSTAGERAFSVCGPRVWNTLPPDIRSATSRDELVDRLTTYFRS